MSNITLGVLQVSVLGPVLFLISMTSMYINIMYINDMHSSSNQMRFLNCSDETTVFASDSDINNVHATVNKELVGVDNWLNTSRFYNNSTSFV